MVLYDRLGAQLDGGGTRPARLADFAEIEADTNWGSDWRAIIGRCGSRGRRVRAGASGGQKRKRKQVLPDAAVAETEWSAG